MSTTWVALLRGINVGRGKRIAMADLRIMLEGLGYAGVRTHGQSGNVAFSFRQSQADSLEQQISTSIRGDFGMDVVVLVRTAAEFAVAVDANPFVARGVATIELHAAFLSAEPSTATTAGIDREAHLPDEFAFGKRVVYLRLPRGIMGSTLPDWDRVLGVRATQRNWRTTTKLRDLVK
jgi:uncharacterized protein (DUF1697 family)